MKYLTIIFLSGILILSSCDDILQEEPKAIAAETFFKNESEIEAAIFGAYKQLAYGPFWRMYLLINLSQVDYGVGRGSFSPISDFQGLDPNNIGRTGGIWEDFYASIRNANIVIERAHTSGVNDTRLNELLAEARFLRGYNYFQLVINWEGVPIRTEENLGELHVPRSSISEVYDLIVDDLEFAETYLPENQEMVGRATKMMAKTVLADVYLNMENWSASRDKALEVINSGTYSLVPVSVPDDFYKIFGSDVINSTEEIFYIKYNSQLRGSFVNMMHQANPKYYFGNGAYAAYCPDSSQNKSIVEWDLNDLRRQFNLYNWDIGVGDKTLLYKKFTEPNQTLACDYPIYRYADLLTIYAEADCRANGGPTVDGIEKLNMVRRRGYGYDPMEDSPVDFVLSDYNEESFVDLVIKERLYELFSEHKRFYDLKRTGKLKDVILEVKGITVDDSQLLWPIPNIEYNYNNAIDEDADQNPGY